MSKCPLKLEQAVFQIKRTTANPISEPSIVLWTVVDITDDPDGWFAIVEHHFPDEKHPQTRTISPLLWNNIYHPNTAAAVQEELRKNRQLIDEMYQYIGSLKHYLYAVESLGIIVNNNNKQDNPLQVDIF